MPEDEASRRVTHGEFATFRSEIREWMSGLGKKIDILFQGRNIAPSTYLTITIAALSLFVAATAASVAGAYVIARMLTQANTTAIKSLEGIEARNDQAVRDLVAGLGNELRAEIRSVEAQSSSRFTGEEWERHVAPRFDRIEERIERLASDTAGSGR